MLINFKQFFKESKRFGRGTGTERQNRFDKQTEDWSKCEHKCPIHGIWKHKIAPGFSCHLSAIHPCEECLYVDNPMTQGMAKAAQKRLKK